VVLDRSRERSRVCRNDSAFWPFSGRRTPALAQPGVSGGHEVTRRTGVVRTFRSAVAGSADLQVCRGGVVRTFRSAAMVRTFRSAVPTTHQQGPQADSNPIRNADTLPTVWSGPLELDFPRCSGSRPPSLRHLSRFARDNPAATANLHDPV